MPYLDHAATTDVLPSALAAFTAAAGLTGNPSSLHGSGRAARKEVEVAREQIARSLGARPSEVVFTGGGTEADNLAVKGLFWERQAADARRVRVLISPTEHHAVLDPAEWLAVAEGAVVEYLPVDPAGRVRLPELADLIAADPRSIALISVMWANNETGVVQPITEIVELAKPHRIPVHSDAVQAVGCLDVDFAASGLSALSFSGHKLGAPCGVGGLLLQRAYKPTPVMHGGGQERDVRSGTVPTALIAALGAALSEAVSDRDGRCRRIKSLRDSLVAGVLAAVPDAELTAVGTERLPGIAHFTFPGCEGHTLLMLLDQAGIRCSAGSACTAGVHRPSHVLEAMGVPPERAMGSLRLSLGRSSSEEDVAAVIAALPAAVAKARAAAATST